MKKNCFLCQKKEPKFGRLCSGCIDTLKEVVYDGTPVSTIHNKYPSIDFKNASLKTTKEPRDILYDLFLARNFVRVTHANERLLSYGYVFDLDVDSTLKIINFICIIAHSTLIKSGAEYGNLLREYGEKRVRKALIKNESGDFIRPSSDFFRYEHSLGALSGHSGFVGGELSTFSFVKIPFSLYTSYMLSVGEHLFEDYLVEQHPKILKTAYSKINTSILYISTKISPNYLKQKFSQLFSNPAIDFKRGFLRTFFEEITDEHNKKEN